MGVYKKHAGEPIGLRAARRKQPELVYLRKYLGDLGGQIMDWMDDLKDEMTGLHGRTYVRR